MDEREEDGVFGLGFAIRVGAIAEGQAEGVCALVPCPESNVAVGIDIEERFDAVETWLFKWVGEIGGREAVTEEFGECSAVTHCCLV